MGYTEVFGGNTIYPSDVSYLALALDADVVLQWPLEAAPGPDVVARIIDVTPSGAHSIFMPPADQTGTGQTVMFKNLGPNTITVKDADGGTIVSIAAGLTWTIYLTDNTTTAGTWEKFQAGASTAQAQASALAGFGLVAQGSLLSQSQDVTLFNSNFTLGATDRASAFVWTGSVGTVTLPSAGAVGNNWFVALRNNGSGNLTVAPSGINLINGGPDLVLRPGDSATINTDGSDFYTIGLGQDPVFAFDYTSIDLTGQSSPYTLSGAELNRIAYSFVGVLTADMVVIIPPTTQQYWLANNTTGAFDLSFGTASQVAPLTVAQGARGIYYCNGADLVKADTASIAVPIAVSDGGTGATTAGGALINLGGSSAGITVFTASTTAIARAAIAAAKSGANSDITSLTGLTTPLSVAQGGSGAATLTGYLKGNGTSAFSAATSIPFSDITGTVPVGQGGSGATTLTGYLKGNGASAFSAATSIPFSDITGTVPVGQGGSGATTLTGYLIGNGASAFTAAATIPFSDITGTVPVSQGGTGQTSYTDGQLLIGNSSGNTLTKATLTAGSGVSITNGGGSITIAATGSGGTVTSVGSGAGLTGGPITGTGSLAIDYTSANSWTGKQTFSGSSSVLAAKLINAVEKVTVSATAATGTINYDITTQSVLYYTTNAGANWTVNLRASSGTSLDTALATGESVTCAFMVTQGATPYYNTTVQVDGTTSGVTTKWQGGAPTAGNANSIDVYTYTVIKTGSATFTVLASLTKFA